MWIHPSTSTVYRSHSEIRAAFPNVSFPSVITDSDLLAVSVLPVTLTPKPEHNPIIHKAVEAAPALVNGQWVQRWTVEPLTPQEQQAVALRIKQEILDATQARLDNFARTRNYDNILSACTYATSTVPKFAAEGQYCVNARDSTWATLYTILAEVQAGTRPMPSGYADIEPLLPVLGWPV